MGSVGKQIVPELGKASGVQGNSGNASTAAEKALELIKELSGSAEEVSELSEVGMEGGSWTRPRRLPAPATLLRAMILALDSPPIHLPSHSSTNLLLHTTLPFTDNPVPTLVNSGTTNNFINESLAALAPHPLQCLPTPIPLKLFDGNPTPAGDITHCLETTMIFANVQQQELRLLITKLHPSALIVLGFSWLHSTNPCVDWPSLTLCLDQDNPTDSRLLRFRSTQSFIINVQLNDSSKVFPALVKSGAFSTFVSNQLGLWRNDLDKPLELQLFDGSPTMTRITQYHNNTLTLNNDLQLPWLQDVNPDIDWKDLTMQFPGPKASLAATIPLRLQSIPDLNVSHPAASTSGATQSPSTSNDNPNKEGDATPPWSLSGSADDGGSVHWRVLTRRTQCPALITRHLELERRAWESKLINIDQTAASSGSVGKEVEVWPPSPSPPSQPSSSEDSEGHRDCCWVEAMYRSQLSAAVAGPSGPPSGTDATQPPVGVVTSMRSKSGICSGVVQLVPEGSRVVQVEVTPEQFAEAVGRARGPPTLEWCQAAAPCASCTRQGEQCEFEKLSQPVPQNPAHHPSTP
ncbi:hypothetical protein E4T56_gene19433 [Termitomyces sp. T112]|nr:hypothetical protein E4T56_gene19433 [Termitomyces sp. T112]